MNFYMLWMVQLNASSLKIMQSNVINNYSLQSSQKYYFTFNFLLSDIVEAKTYKKYLLFPTRFYADTVIVGTYISAWIVTIFYFLTLYARVWRIHHIIFKNPWLFLVTQKFINFACTDHFVILNQCLKS